MLADLVGGEGEIRPATFAPPLMDLRLGPLNIGVELLRLVHGSGREAASVAAGQVERLAAMAHHARENVCLYQRHWQDVSDLTKVPTLDKAIVREAAFADRLGGPVPVGSRRLVTTGSTGQPMEVIYPPGFARWQGVLEARMDLARGIKPWHRRAMLTFSPDTRQGGGALGWLRRQRILALATDGPPEELAERLGAWHPHVVVGHAHVLLDIAQHLEPSRRPAVAGTLGESVDAATREALARSFGRPAFDTYGTSEVGVVAWQCHAVDLYHVNHESVLVEILDEHGDPVPPGTPGEIVLSGLGNFLMPFVRYRIGDMGRWADRPCACGHRLPSLASIDGRTMDRVVAADGARLAPQRLWLFNHLDPVLAARFVSRYRVRQDRSGAVVVEVQLADQAPPGMLEGVEASYRTLLGAGLPIEIRQVAQLRPDRHRKFRLVESELR